MPFAAPPSGLAGPESRIRRSGHGRPKVRRSASGRNSGTPLGGKVVAGGLRRDARRRKGRRGAKLGAVSNIETDRHRENATKTSALILGLAAGSFAMIVTIGQLGRDEFDQSGWLQWSLGFCVVALPAAIVAGFLKSFIESEATDRALNYIFYSIMLGIYATAAGLVAFVGYLSPLIASISAGVLVVAWFAAWSGRSRLLCDDEPNPGK